MSQIVNKIKYVDSLDQCSDNSDTLFVVISSDKRVDLCFNNKLVSNFETVKSLNSNLCDDKFYVLNSGGSIYYKYYNPEVGESLFIPICIPEVERVSFTESSGLEFLVSGKSLRLLTLSDSGGFSLGDLSHIVSCNRIPEIDCRIIWERTHDG